MHTGELIEVVSFCRSHSVSFEYIIELRESGLIEIVSSDETYYIRERDLARLEQIVHFKNELEINLPGVEVILRLLDRIEQMQLELTGLRNRLDEFGSGR